MLFDFLDLARMKQFYAGTRLHDAALTLSPQWLEENVKINGLFPHWHDILMQLPVISESDFCLKDSVKITGICQEKKHLEHLLKALMPWRKGPIEIAGIKIDTEWRSDWKWDRISSALNLRGQHVLDVGCGNSYYGLRMLGAGAESVLGIDPNFLFLSQFHAIKRYLPLDLPIWQLPCTLEQICDPTWTFDVVFSMGVLYHRRSPIDHLQALKELLRPYGTLVLETMIVDGDAQTVLVPRGRYAQMRNVWYVPSVKALEVWLHRVGFINIRVLDVSVTSLLEQRRTEWMQYDSLQSFLDPADMTKTCEGYPAPKRVMIVAQVE